MAAETGESMFELITVRGPFGVRAAFSGLNALLKKVTGLAGLERLYREIRSMRGPERFTDLLSA